MTALVFRFTAMFSFIQLVSGCASGPEESQEVPETALVLAEPDETQYNGYAGVKREPSEIAWLAGTIGGIPCGEPLATMTAIALAESDGYTKAWHNYGVDRGLWQINRLWGDPNANHYHLPQGVDLLQLYCGCSGNDPSCYYGEQCNAALMGQISKFGQDFYPWDTFNPSAHPELPEPPYLKHMSTGRAAAAQACQPPIGALEAVTYDQANGYFGAYGRAYDPNTYGSVASPVSIYLDGNYVYTVAASINWERFELVFKAVPGTHTICAKTPDLGPSAGGAWAVNEIQLGRCIDVVAY